MLTTMPPTPNADPTEKCVEATYSRLLRPLRFAARVARTDDRGRPVFHAGHGLSPGERGDLEADAIELRVVLEPARPLEAAAEIAPLLELMHAKRLDSDTAVAMAGEAYMEAIDGEPLVAIVRARRAFFRGETNLDPHWRPSPPELAQLVKAQALPFREQLARVDILLDAAVEIAVPATDPGRIEAAVERFRRGERLAEPA